MRRRVRKSCGSRQNRHGKGDGNEIRKDRLRTPPGQAEHGIGIRRRGDHSATESTEGIVMEMLRHERMILLPAVVSAPRLRGTESPSDILGAARIRKGKTVRIRHPRISRVAASHEGRTTPLFDRWFASGRRSGIRGSRRADGILHLRQCEYWTRTPAESIDGGSGDPVRSDQLS